MTGFALFSLFFGAGNLILPPSLGVKSGMDWWIVVIGFSLTAVVIPIFAIYAHSRLQGTLFDFGKRVSSTFSTVFCVLIYIISVSIPSPRTAAVTHEMAVQPNWEISPLVTSIIYFSLVFIFAINRSKIISIIGKYLTPIIVLIIIAIVVKAILLDTSEFNPSEFEVPFVDGFLEGYQTFDAIGGVVVGAVIIISLNLRGYTSYEAKKELITKSGFIAGGGLLLMYGGLIASGAVLSESFSKFSTRTDVLINLSNETLGNVGTTFLSVLVALACFTTGVGIVTGTADYVKGLFNDSKTAYTITALVGCILGVVIGQFDVHYIIVVALPVLMFIYPITVVLIILNVLGDKWRSQLVFRGTVLVAFVFSIPDFLGFLVEPGTLDGIQNMIPLSKHHMGWVLPTILTFVLLNFKTFTTKPQEAN